MTESSQMSTMESSMGDATGGKKDEDTSNKVFAMLVVVAILLLLSIVGVKMASGAGPTLSNNDDYDDDDDGKKGPSPANDPGFVFKAPPPPPPTTRRTRKSTTTLVTPSASADNFVEPPSTARPPKPQPGEQVDTILCVVGQEAMLPKFPDDGLCDLTFYADLIYSDGTFKAKLMPTSWTVFQSVAEQSKKTGYGVSADIGPDSKFAQAFASGGNGKTLLKQLFDKKIVHHGVLNAENSEATLEKSVESSSGLGLIKTFRQLHTDWGAADNHLVVGVRFTSYKFSSTNKNKANTLKAIISKLSPTIVVVHTHTNAWTKDQKPVCMTPWEDPSYGRDVQPNMICKGVIKHKDYDTKADLYIWSHDNYFSFCAETTETIVSKMKKWFQVKVPKRHGIAFFDIDMDDFADSCRNGSFSRIKEVKHYLRT